MTTKAIKFFVDESAGYGLVEWLESRCFAGGYVLLMADKDFSDWVFR